MEGVSATSPPRLRHVVKWCKCMRGMVLWNLPPLPPRCASCYSYTNVVYMMYMVLRYRKRPRIACAYNDLPGGSGGKTLKASNHAGFRGIATWRKRGGDVAEVAENVAEAGETA